MQWIIQLAWFYIIMMIVLLMIIYIIIIGGAMKNLMLLVKDKDPVLNKSLVSYKYNHF